MLGVIVLVCRDSLGHQEWKGTRDHLATRHVSVLPHTPPRYTLLMVAI